MRLSALTGGAGDGPALVLLHGFGATREVWLPLIARLETRWGGRWIAPDLRGHGRSGWGEAYGLGAHAADVAELLIGRGLDADAIVLGHSMGGAVALALASGWFGMRPKSALSLGVKLEWSPAELEGMARLAGSPVRRFPSEAAAVERYGKTSGLAGLVDPASPIARAGVVNEPEGWRLAADPKAARVGAPDFDSLFAVARSPIRLARGETDPMSTTELMRRWDPAAVTLAGLGHNAMVEGADAVLDWLLGHAAGEPGAPSR